MRRILTIIICIATVLTASAQNYRERIGFDKDWQFAFGDASSPSMDFGCGTEYFNYLTKASSIHNEGPYSQKFDASGWALVDLPHDWVVDLPYAAEASHSHGYKTVGYKYPETSVGWYRKTFTIPAEDYGKHIWLQFDGIFRDARIWVNGFYLGHEPSGYATQTYDISEYLNYGGENLVCVRADATLEEGWFYEGAGIYRHVWLNKASKVHVAPFGTFVYSEFAAPYSLRGETGPDLSLASLHIETTVQNMGVTPSGYSVRHILKDAEGNVAGEAVAEGAMIEGKASHVSKTAIPVEKPHLWSCDDPYLYTVVTEVTAGGEVVDSYETVTGIRHIAFDHDRGFFLNEKPVKLKGVNMHQDHAGVGAGIPDGLQEWRLLQLKKFGCNAYRSSHNPMTPEMLDACDRLGILVIEENRLTGVNRKHTDLLGRMIRRDRNHPSIILWSVGNEEWGIEWKETGTRIAESMREYCHRFDPTRLMTVASSSGPAILIPADVAGYNYILQNPVEKHRADYPERCALGSEETTGCGTRGVYFNVTDGRKPSAVDAGNGRMVALNRSKHGPDSVYNCIERGWKFYAGRDYLAGLFYWTGFDYRGEPNPMEFPATSSEFGILDYCGFPKDEAYYLKAWWTSEPVLHILPHWNLDGHEGEKISVWAYSNCDEVQLIVNGKKIGRKKMPVNGHLEWEATYKPGYVKAIGYRNGRKVMETRIETAGEPVNAVWTYDTVGDIMVANVEMRDAKGRFVPTANCEIEFTAPQTGWKILGWGNGDPAYQYIERPFTTGEAASCQSGTPAPDPSAESVSIRTFNGCAQVILQKK
ncbi:MAG: glycoside hydrolase family 2 protein [Bacteroidales bacterium]|nr:glycoside hydrolase family 2 protein [Bacteroidales bacterium]